MAGEDDAHLQEIKKAMSHYAWEQAHFFIKLAEQIDSTGDTLPEPKKLKGAMPAYGPKGRKIRKDKGKKKKGKKRGMTAYNLFIKEKMPVLKETDPEKYKEHKVLFKDTAALWKGASAQEKEKFSLKLEALKQGENEKEPQEEEEPQDEGDEGDEGEEDEEDEEEDDEGEEDEDEDEE